jgi:hypothetical protein
MMPRTQLNPYRSRFFLAHRSICHELDISDPNYEYTPSRIDRFIAIYSQIIYNAILLSTFIVLVLLLVRHTTFFALWVCR